MCIHSSKLLHIHTEQQFPRPGPLNTQYGACCMLIIYRRDTMCILRHHARQQAVALALLYLCCSTESRPSRSCTGVLPCIHPAAICANVGMQQHHDQRSARTYLRRISADAEHAQDANVCLNPIISRNPHPERPSSSIPGPATYSQPPSNWPRRRAAVHLHMVAPPACSAAV